MKRESIASTNIKTFGGDEACFLFGAILLITPHCNIAHFRTGRCEAVRTKVRLKACALMNNGHVNAISKTRIVVGLTIQTADGIVDLGTNTRHLTWSGAEFSCALCLTIVPILCAVWRTYRCIEVQTSAIPIHAPTPTLIVKIIFAVTTVKINEVTLVPNADIIATVWWKIFAGVTAKSATATTFITIILGT